MIRKSLIALFLAYILCVLLPVFLHRLFAGTALPSDSYADFGSYRTGIYKEVAILIFILLLFTIRKRVSKWLRLDKVIYFHFLIYLFFYNAVILFFICSHHGSELIYSITGARKVRDSIYGYTYPAGGTRHEAVYHADSLLFKATYTFDSLGRRYTAQPEVHKSRSTIFFGCSFTYGDGVNDDETLPARYAALDTGDNVYNYAIDGWGPQQALLQIIRRDLPQETYSDTALGIYVWIDDHLKRAAMYKSHYLGWTQYFPCFMMEGDSLACRGSFETLFPARGLFFEILDNSIFFKNIDIPTHESSKDYELSCAILKAMQKDFVSKFKSGKFIVLLYPGNGAELAPYLKGAGIDYIKAEKNILSDADFIPIHGHPNKYANNKLAAFLYQTVK